MYSPLFTAYKHVAINKITVTMYEARNINKYIIVKPV